MARSAHPTVSPAQKIYQCLERWPRPPSNGGARPAARRYVVEPFKRRSRISARPTIWQTKPARVRPPARPHPPRPTNGSNDKPTSAAVSAPRNRRPPASVPGNLPRRSITRPSDSQPRECDDALYSFTSAAIGLGKRSARRPRDRSNGASTGVGGVHRPRNQKCGSSNVYLPRARVRGDAEGALTRIDEALGLAGQTEHWSDAFLYRWRGEILLKRDATNTAPAAGCVPHGNRHRAAAEGAQF
jgi:hypothetical protein